MLSLDSHVELLRRDQAFINKWFHDARGTNWVQFRGANSKHVMKFSALYVKT